VYGFSHVQLLVRDLDVSERWYAQVLGLVRFAADPASGYVALRHPSSGFVVVLTEAGGDTSTGGALDHLAFAVTDGDGLRDWAEAAWYSSWASPRCSCATPTAPPSSSSPRHRATLAEPRRPTGGAVEISLDGWDIGRFDDVEWAPWGSAGNARAKTLASGDAYVASAGTTRADFTTESGATYLSIFRL